MKFLSLTLDDPQELRPWIAEWRGLLLELRSVDEGARDLDLFLYTKLTGNRVIPMAEDAGFICEEQVLPNTWIRSGHLPLFTSNLGAAASLIPPDRYDLNINVRRKPRVMGVCTLMADDTRLLGAMAPRPEIAVCIAALMAHVVIAERQETYSWSLSHFNIKSLPDAA